MMKRKDVNAKELTYLSDNKDNKHISFNFYIANLIVKL